MRKREGGLLFSFVLYPLKLTFFFILCIYCFYNVFKNIYLILIIWKIAIPCGVCNSKSKKTIFLCVYVCTHLKYHAKKVHSQKTLDFLSIILIFIPLSNNNSGSRASWSTQFHWSPLTLYAMKPGGPLSIGTSSHEEVKIILHVKNCMNCKVLYKVG